jgi:chromosome segregation ATPase
VFEQGISEFESASDESSDDENPPKLIKLPTRTKNEEHFSADSSSDSEDCQSDPDFQSKPKRSSSADSSSDSEDCQSNPNFQSKPKKSRQQIGKKLKYFSKQMDVTNENIGNFEGRLVGIEDDVSNISKELDSMKTVHKSGISALKNTMENGSNSFERNIQKLQNELKSMSESSAKLESKLEESQNLSKDLDIKLCKSQMMQKESNDELKKLQKESSIEISNLKNIFLKL